MKIKKLYFNKLYNQWRDFPFIYEKLNEGLCIRVLGIEYNKDIIDNITANFKDLDNIEYIIQNKEHFSNKILYSIYMNFKNNTSIMQEFICFILCLSKETISFEQLIKINVGTILNNDGLYEVVFSIQYQNDKCEKLPIQTFEMFKNRKLNKSLTERYWDLPDYTIRKERFL